MHDNKTYNKGRLVPALLLCLFFVTTTRCAISLTAQVDSNLVVLIDNGVVQSPFDSLSAAKENLFLRVEDQPVTFSLSADQDYSYSLTSITLSEDAPYELSIPNTGDITTGSTTNFTLSFDCAANSFPLFVWLWEFKGASGFEQYSVYWMKECRVANCSDECALHGTCNVIRGECNCDPEWFGANCNINFRLTDYGPYCGTDRITAYWNIPEDLSSTTDWIALYSDFYADALIENVAEWYYLNNAQAKVAGRHPNPVGSAEYRFWVPGNFTLYLFAEDGYDILASYPIQILDWAQCLPQDWDCARDCKSGSCDENGLCNCELGFFSYDCSLGCNGTVVLTESSGIFDNGWGDRNYGFVFDAENPLIEVQCGWLISPSIALDKIESSKRKVLGVTLTLNFLGFDVARSNPISIFEGNASSVTLLAELSGQSLPPSVVSESNSAFLAFSPNNLGFRGFRISYFVDIIDEPIFEVLLIDFNHPAGLGIAIVTLFLCAVTVAVAILLLARRSHFIVRASSIIFCLIIVLGVLFGYGAIFTFLGEPTVVGCALRLWLASIGFVLVFGCLFLKNFRIYKIFANKKLKKFKMGDTAVLKLLGLLLLFEVVILVLWTVFDLPEVVIQTNLQDQTQAMVCRWNHIAFVAVSLFAKAVLMVFGVYLSVKTRKAMTFYRESKFVGISIYSFFVTATIFISILYIISNFYVVWWILITLGLILIFTLTLIIIFGRIIYYIFKFPADQPPESILNKQRSVTVLASPHRGSVNTSGSASTANANVAK